MYLLLILFPYAGLLPAVQGLPEGSDDERAARDGRVVPSQLPALLRQRGGRSILRSVHQHAEQLLEGTVLKYHVHYFVSVFNSMAFGPHLAWWLAMMYKQPFHSELFC